MELDSSPPEVCVKDIESRERCVSECESEETETDRQTDREIKR